MVPSSVYSVEAYSYASRFVLRDVAAFFPGGDTGGSTKTQLIVAWAADSRAYAFDFGALVFINVPDKLREQILASFAAHLPREPHPPLHEDFLIEVRPLYTQQEVWRYGVAQGSEVRVPLIQAMF